MSGHWADCDRANTSFLHLISSSAPLTRRDDSTTLRGLVPWSAATVHSTAHRVQAELDASAETRASSDAMEQPPQHDSAAVATLPRVDSTDETSCGSIGTSCSSNPCGVAGPCGDVPVKQNTSQVRPSLPDLTSTTHLPSWRCWVDDRPDAAPRRPCVPASTRPPLL